MPDLPAYTVAAVAAPVAVVALELLVLRTGLLRRLQYWASMVVLLGFQVLFGGWLTKPHAPVVHYADEPTIGLRAPLWFPVEDFGFWRRDADPDPVGVALVMVAGRCPAAREERT